MTNSTTTSICLPCVITLIVIILCAVLKYNGTSPALSETTCLMLAKNLSSVHKYYQSTTPKCWPSVNKDEDGFLVFTNVCTKCMETDLCLHPAGCYAVDSLGTNFKFYETEKGFHGLSAGADKKYDTKDDVCGVVTISGHIIIIDEKGKKMELDSEAPACP